MRRTLLVAVLLLVACGSEKPVRLAMHLAETEPAEGLTPMVHEATGEPFYLHPEPAVTEADVDSAWVSMRDNRPVVDLLLNDRGREAFARLTGDNVGKHVAMVVDGRLLLAPMVRAPILQGRAVIDWDATPEEAEGVARGLMLR
jgi:preprotein translocase subunit SecD